MQHLIQWPIMHYQTNQNIQLDRSYHVSTDTYKSENNMPFRAWQGSILGSLLINQYMPCKVKSSKKDRVAYNSYANDTQIYVFLLPNDFRPIDSVCLHYKEVDGLIQQNFFQLNRNTTKTVATQFLPRIMSTKDFNLCEKSSCNHH